MKPKDLRIGNLIYNGIEEVFPANGETISNFQLGQAILGEFKPIPLTEEWLLKFGLGKSKQPNGHIFYGQRSIFFRIINHPHRGDIFYLFGYEFTVVIEYVHQLQNLYFALTGTELNLNIEL